jgi:hypothetical protein
MNVIARSAAASGSIGGHSLTAEIRLRSGIVVCRRVSEAIEAADASAKNAQMN